MIGIFTLGENPACFLIFCVVFFSGLSPQGFLRRLGNIVVAARSMLTSFFGTLVFPIGALLAMTPFLALNGVCLSALVSCTASAMFTVMLYLTMKKSKEKTS